MGVGVGRFWSALIKTAELVGLGVGSVGMCIDIGIWIYNILLRIPAYSIQ